MADERKMMEMRCSCGRLLGRYRLGEGAAFEVKCHACRQIRTVEVQSDKVRRIPGSRIIL